MLINLTIIIIDIIKVINIFIVITIIQSSLSFIPSHPKLSQSFLSALPPIVCLCFTLYTSSHPVYKLYTCLPWSVRVCTCLHRRVLFLSLPSTPPTSCNVQLLPLFSALINPPPIQRQRQQQQRSYLFNFSSHICFDPCFCFPNSPSVCVCVYFCVTKQVI